MRNWAVYRHYSSHGYILYVGMTGNLPLRTQDHLENSPWRESIARIDATLFETKEEALDAERQEIQGRNPPWNRQKPKPKDWTTTPQAAPKKA